MYSVACIENPARIININDKMRSNRKYKIYKAPKWMTEIHINNEGILHEYNTSRIGEYYDDDVYTGPNGIYTTSLSFSVPDHSKYDIHYPTFGQTWYINGITATIEHVYVDTEKDKTIITCYTHDQMSDNTNNMEKWTMNECVLIIFNTLQENDIIKLRELSLMSDTNEGDCYIDITNTLFHDHSSSEDMKLTTYNNGSKKITNTYTHKHRWA
jgi:hypothetical protein